MKKNKSNNLMTKPTLTIELINEPLELKKKGDTCFNNFNFVQGVDHYNAAIEKVKYLQTTYPDELRNNFQQEKHTINNVAIGCHLNLGLCYLKMEDYESCINECDKVLKLDNTNCTALYRRTKCNIELNNLSESVKDLDELKKHCKDKKDIEELEKEMKIKFKIDFLFIIRQIILIYLHKVYNDYIKDLPFVGWFLPMIKTFVIKPFEFGIYLLLIWKKYTIDVPISILSSCISFMKAKEDYKEEINR